MSESFDQHLHGFILCSIRFLFYPSSDDFSISVLPTFTPMPHLVTVKLGHDNFLPWKAQFGSLFTRVEIIVFGYLDRSIPTPLIDRSLFLLQPPEMAKHLVFLIQLAHQRWIQQDQVLLSTIMSLPR